MGLSQYKTAKERCTFLEKELGVTLTDIQKGREENEAAIHCENRIGFVHIPLGVAGPIQIMGQHIKGSYHIPLATTEGALVASVSRGAKATHEGGIITSVERVGTTRGPVIKASSIGGASRIEKWIWEHMEQLALETETTSHHIKLIDLEVKKTGMYLFLRFYFDTDRAMGMNMATIATQHLIEVITKKTKSDIISVAGNYDVDKKPSWLNIIRGRGFVVHAEAIVSKKTVEAILKTTGKKIYEVWKAKCMIGSALSGSMGFNAHHANVVAAFYAATGQDIAHTVEGSVGMTIVDILEDESLYISVNLPNIMVGTIGGGTGLSTQKEALSFIKTDSPYGLAEALGAGVLAGELSLLASLSAGTLASAHKALGRIQT